MTFFSNEYEKKTGQELEIYWKNVDLQRMTEILRRKGEAGRQTCSKRQRRCLVFRMI